MPTVNQLRIQSTHLHNTAQFKTGGFKHAIVVIIAASILHPATEFIIDNVKELGFSDEDKIVQDALRVRASLETDEDTQN